MANDIEKQKAEIEALLKKLGQKIGQDMPKGMGFTLFIFDIGPHGNMFYISNAQRADMIKSLEEFIGRQKTGDVREYSPYVPKP